MDVMFKNPSNWKVILTGLVSGLIIYTVALDFTNPVHPDWNLFEQEELPTATEMYGAKAAILAMAGAATLFIGFIPTRRSNRSRRIDLLIQVSGAIAVALTGWFWLLSATDGHPGPYLVAIVPSMAVFVLTLIVFVVLRLAEDRDEEQVQETGSAKLTWGSVVMLLVMLLVVALSFASIIGAVVFLPKWLF